MFGGGMPEMSKAEIAAAERETNQYLMATLGSCVLLYLSPFAVDYITKLV